ncbi:hypothetical protein RA263_28575, partial [Pseudomonas syringae pv. tagetis]|uniref:hypothetical protein n=1 Tax=Pseudomonas syringae group genomosp. 7 TaxID=251699 RepID=UPI0037703812
VVGFFVGFGVVWCLFVLGFVWGIGLDARFGGVVRLFVVLCVVVGLCWGFCGVWRGGWEGVGGVGVVVWGVGCGVV